MGELEMSLIQVTAPGVRHDWVAVERVDGMVSEGEPLPSIHIGIGRAPLEAVFALLHIKTQSEYSASQEEK